MHDLRLSQVSLHYGPAPREAVMPVLKDVSLTIERGAFISVIGRSGSGKTSLMNLAAGFIPPTGGAIHLGDQRVTGPGPERAVVFQEDALMPWRSVAENVALSLKLRGMGRQERLQKAQSWLEAVGLSDKANHPIWQLSGGQRQRVGIARALAAQPDFLLMDEPLGALDAMTREQMHEVLLALWQGSNVGAMLITHSVEEALFLSTSVVVLAPNPGRVIWQEDFNFSRRYCAGEPMRALKSEPEFIAARERLMAAIYEKETG